MFHRNLTIQCLGAIHVCYLLVGMGERNCVRRCHDNPQLKTCQPICQTRTYYLVLIEKIWNLPQLVHQSFQIFICLFILTLIICFGGSKCLEKFCRVPHFQSSFSIWILFFPLLLHILLLITNTGATISTCEKCWRCIWSSELYHGNP